MLQPLQLKEVSALYAKEIPELRAFLATAGLPVGTAAALSSMAERLRTDRAFHRDLALHLWVATHTRAEAISYANQLGMLAVAAAGERFAASTEEPDAHELLRFLMESRTTAAPPPAPLTEAPPLRAPAPASDPFSAAVRAAVAPSPDAPPPVRPVPIPPFVDRQAFLSPASPELPHRAPPAEEPHPVQRDYRRALWLGAAACLLLILFTGLWLHRRAAMNSTTASTPTAPSTTATPYAAPNTGASTAPTPSGETTAANSAPAEITAEPPSPATNSRAASKPSPSTRAATRDLPPASPRAAAPAYPAVAAVTPPTPAPTPSPVTTVAAPTAARPPGSVAYPGSRPSNNGLIGSAVPPPPSSRNITQPTIAYRSANDAGEYLNGPRLLRRHPPSAFVPYVEEEAAPTGSSRAVNTSSPAPTPARGIVRQASLGMMASNVLYSPAPAYPAAASAAHVEGEVKIEAEVDRNGNVGSARVVSGPPLLRDAALDAVQHWRYRPYTAGGKPIPMAATAVIEFQLP